MVRLLTRALCMAVVGGLLLGCASPEYRIKKNPELFASFPPEAQGLIQEGRIDIGFTADMVAIALGSPNRIYARQTETEEREVWAYTSTRETMDRQRVRADYRTRDAQGKIRTGSDWVYVDVPRETEFDRMRVEFREGKVVAIDRLQR